MAKEEELGIRLRIKGLATTRRALSGLTQVMGKVAKTAKDVGKSVSRAGQRDVPGAGVSKGIRQSALGSLAGNIMAQSFQTFSQNIKTAFDPNLTKTERQLSLGTSVLDAIPLIGGVASGILSNLAQTQVGVAQGTQSKLNQIFGPAFEAFGSANPDLGDVELQDALAARFGPAVNRIRGQIESQERGRELGSQFLAEQDEGLDIQALKDKAIRTAKEQLGINPDILNEAIEAFADAGDNFRDNVKDFSTAVQQYKDFYGELFGIGGNTR